MNKPNIIFIVADDHRASAVGRLGIEPVATPTLDALARRGTVLSQMRTMSGWCGAVSIPSRSCIHTGRDIKDVVAARPEDLDQAGFVLPETFPLMGEFFRKAGYATHGIGKWHNDAAAFNRSFSSGAAIFFGGMSDHDKVPLHDYRPEGDYSESNSRLGDGFSTEIFADAAVDFIQGHPGDAPFLLYVALTSPHDPRTPPPPFDGIRAESISLPPNFLSEHPFDNGEMDIRDEKLAAFPREPEEIRQHIADYYGMISHHDHQIGRILDALEQRGQKENTIVVYTADHGLAIGQHGLMGKQNLYEHSLRTPFIVAGPGIPVGGNVTGPAMEMDILPTLLDLAGVAPHADFDGLSFADAIAERSHSPRAFGHALYGECQSMVTDGHWKLIRYRRVEGTGRGTNARQLFHLAEDPWEIHDLSSTPGGQEQIARLEREIP